MSVRSAPISACAALVFAMATVGLATEREARPPEPPAAAPRSVGPRVPTHDRPLDVNRASARELEALPGIGPRAAERIVAARATRGALRGLADLDAIPGVGPRTLERIAPLVRFDVSGPASARP